MSQTPAVPAATPTSGYSERWVVGLVASCVLISVANTTMVNVALPDIGDHFDASPGRLGLLVTLYSLTFGIATPFYGRLGDRYGLRRMFVIGLSIFTACSLLAGSAPTFPLLILFRAGQALGSAAIPSLGIGMIARAIPPERRGRALGIVSTGVGIGSGLGPTLGGSLTQFISWRMVFLISCALALLIPWVLRKLPNPPGDRSRGVDWLGGVALAGTIAGFLQTVSGVQRFGIGSPVVISAIVVGSVSLVLCIWRQRSAAEPFIERVLLADRRYVFLCLTGFCAMAGTIGAQVSLPFLLEDVNGLSAGKTGLALLPMAVAVALLARTAGRMADSGNPYRLITIGLIISLSAAIVLASFAIGLPPVAVAGIAAFLGVGQAFFNSPLSTTLTRTVPQRVYGVGLGLYNMLFFVGGGFGASLSTALVESRANSSTPLLPTYTGPAEHIAYSDAFLPTICVFIVGIVVIRLGARAARR